MKAFLDFLAKLLASFKKTPAQHPPEKAVDEKPNLTSQKSRHLLDIAIPSIDFRPSKTWTHIILHHSATPDQKTHDWEAIRNFHTSYRIDGVIVSEEVYIESKKRGHKGYHSEPWSDIGYHFGVERVGGILKVLPGRQLFRGGAHCKGMNFKALGICFVGNFDKAAPDSGMLKAGVTLVRHLIKNGDRLKAFNIPVENVQGHRDYARKTCPGERFDVAGFREDVESALA